MVWGALRWDAHAASGSQAAQAQSLMGELESETAAGELLRPAMTRAREALARAEALSPDAPEHAALVEGTALQWAQVARDLKRARDAELASDHLEQELSATQTEVVRSRAAVEQAKARVGRARQDLAGLEAAAAQANSPPPAPGAH